jgi:hypothetical protein
MIESCNALDDDCNGTADDGIAPRACSTACGSGTETCVAGAFVGCTAPPVIDELCNDVDDDCDGTIDDGVTRGCSSACGSGIETCTAGSFGACTAPAPMTETCNNADDDCDGSVDDGLTRSCSTACGTGIETCSAGSFGGCTAPMGPCDLTPTMTGPTAPSGTVTTSGDFSGYPGWWAFDSATGPGNMWLSEIGVAPAWVAYELSAPRTVTQYGVQYTNGSLTSRAPRDWQFQGFNGTSWVTLDTRTAQTAWTQGEVRTFTIAAPAAYRRYRLHVTNDNDDSQPIVVVSIGELYLTGY